jgi:hypothetical protein
VLVSRKVSRLGARRGRSCRYGFLEGEALRGRDNDMKTTEFLVSVLMALALLGRGATSQQDFATSVAAEAQRLWSRVSVLCGTGNDSRGQDHEAASRAWFRYEKMRRKRWTAKQRETLSGVSLYVSLSGAVPNSASVAAQLWEER